ncbi:unnamed protein product [Brachionus calyciflorus]|uniref:Uncharacterized protein n=1 Tax=Brachionus calyciflorus TaxID=104777 RepID=A0A814E019_9BILA|nr:unnamed protein product [Brachionus calyciflorus]
MIFVLVFVFGILANVLTINCQFVSNQNGELDAGNWSYYKYTQKYQFRLVLESLNGDCDLYASDKVPYVDYSNYDLQSITYGNDEILIESSMRRPIYVSVYAHPYYANCKYNLRQYREENEYNSYKEHSESLKHDDDDDKQEVKLDTKNDEESEDKENFFWWLFINLIEILAEVIL